MRRFTGKTFERWAGLWRSKNKLDGITEHILFEAGAPMLFRTRKESAEWIEQRYGYIRNRTDLKAEPHGWRMPKPIKVSITIKPVAKAGKR